VASEEERVREQLAVVALAGHAISPITTPALSEKALAGEIGTQVIP
jgi:hypothetical protein